MDPINADKLAAVYIRIRTERQQKTAEYEELDAEYEAQLGEIETALMDICKATGADSIKTKHGTVIRSIRERFWTNDWKAMGDYIVQNNAVDLMEKRLHQGNVKTWIEDHPENFPPGVNVDRKYTITVRKK